VPYGQGARRRRHAWLGWRYFFFGHALADNFVHSLHLQPVAAPDTVAALLHVLFLRVGDADDDFHAQHPGDVLDGCGLFVRHKAVADLTGRGQLAEDGGQDPGLVAARPDDDQAFFDFVLFHNY